MEKIIVENFSEEDLIKIYKELTRKNSWNYECELCEMPEMLHTGVCTREIEIGEEKV